MIPLDEIVTPIFVNLIKDEQGDPWVSAHPFGSMSI